MPKAALYVRLSREDREKPETAESESIMNQQMMLFEYCRAQGWEVYQIYSDEDFSGSDRNRPGFTRLIQDAEARHFDVVLAKTQSRFARDIELVEKYINTLFPIWGIRFVGLVDNTDSDNLANRKFRQLNGIVDQWYLEDLSKNVRDTLAAKRRSGQWVGAFAPFGYAKDPDDKNHLVPDPEAAEIVRYIFKLYLDGYGVNTLTRKLNEEGIPNPAAYKKSKGQAFQNKNRECSTVWAPYSVQRILKSQIYIGDTVQGQTENVSYKSDKKRIKPKEEWDIVKGTHEPIIDEITFYKVQEILASHRRSGKQGTASLFANKVRCLRCGGSMRSQITQKKRLYTCHLHYVAPHLCDGTYISMSVLEKAVLEQLHTLCAEYLDAETVKNKLDTSRRFETKLEAVEKEIVTCTKEGEKIEKRFKQLYYDKVDGTITLEEYNFLKQDCKKELERIQKRLASLKEKQELLEAQREETQNMDAMIARFKDLKELDRRTVETLIDYIEVGGSRHDRIINIHWNF